MNEQNNLQPIEPIQSSKNIWVIIISIIITAVIVGGGVYAWKYSSSQNEKQKLQDEIVRLNQNVAQLEETDGETTEPTGGQDVIDNTKLRILTRDCGRSFSNVNQPVDETITNTLNATSGEFKTYTSEGYRLTEVCKVGNKILLLLDFRTGYLKKMGTVNDTELTEHYESAKNAVIGVAGSQYDSIDFYPITIDDYRFEGSGDVACNFDKHEDNKILYICVDANDGGTSKTWYAYDVNQENNIKVKYIYKGRYDPSRDEEEILDSDLINLFSVKN